MIDLAISDEYRQADKCHHPAGVNDGLNELRRIDLQPVGRGRHEQIKVAGQKKGR